MTKHIPHAPHIVEPYDGQEGMVRCCDCKGSARNGQPGEYRCPRYVPSMATVMQHCNKFRRKT